MIKMSNLADYAVELMCCIALKPTAIHSSVGLSDTAHIPLPTVSKILGTMVRSGFLVSHRGLNGGFSLALCASEISISDIIEAVDGPVQLTNCLGEDTSDCDRISSCGTRSQWYRINEAVKNALGSVLLSQMIESVPDFIGDGKMDDLPLISKTLN
ncbi:MAG: SUF system Fe-S cluster assembly regulator [Emcibacter sp.]|nr:SUF system Fe-S cluster assembly regulator [Emcibacter sp.]